MKIPSLAYFDQLIASCDEMAARTGITWDGKTAMPWPATERTVTSLWERAMECWDAGRYCPHALGVGLSPMPLYFLPTVTGPHTVYCGRCNPPVCQDMWADLPLSVVKKLRCDACGRRFGEWRDIWPVVTNLLDWAVVGRCCFECRNVVTYNRTHIAEPRLDL